MGGEVLPGQGKGKRVGTLRTLRPLDGDVALEWDVTDQASVDAAIAQFETELAPGSRKVAFASKGGVDTMIKPGGFDPAADEIIMFRQMQGG